MQIAAMKIYIFCEYYVVFLVPSPFKGSSFDGGLCSSAEADFVTKGGIFWQNESVLGYI